MKAALDKGWMAWAMHEAELHTYRVDWENRRKEGRGFYKLNEESIAAVREDLTQHYRMLADQHFDEHTAVGRFQGKSRRHFLPANGGQQRTVEDGDNCSTRQ